MDEFWLNVFLNCDIKSCEHYRDAVILPLSLTCKILNQTYKKKLETCCCGSPANCEDYMKHLSYKCRCDICFYRPIECLCCIKNGTSKCVECICEKCNISTNLLGGGKINNKCRLCSYTCYSFALNPIEYAPSGSCNYSTFRKSINLTFAENIHQDPLNHIEHKPSESYNCTIIRNMHQFTDPIPDSDSETEPEYNNILDFF